MVVVAAQVSDSGSHLLPGVALQSLSALHLEPTGPFAAFTTAYTVICEWPFVAPAATETVASLWCRKKVASPGADTIEASAVVKCSVLFEQASGSTMSFTWRLVFVHPVAPFGHRKIVDGVARTWTRPASGSVQTSPGPSMALPPVPPAPAAPPVVAADEALEAPPAPEPEPPVPMSPPDTQLAFDAPKARANPAAVSAQDPRMREDFICAQHKGGPRTGPRANSGMRRAPPCRGGR